MSKDLLQKAYLAFSDETPLKYDCGLLCSSFCCNGGLIEARDSGMYLLPHEKELLAQNDGFTFSENDGETVLLCGGKCNRDFRPFACRIFPFYASFEKTKRRDRIKLLPDPRGIPFCPLLGGTNAVRTNVRFLRRARRAVRILSQDKAMREDFDKTAAFLQEIAQMRSLFFPIDS